jgi:hypothetical protein
VILAAALVASVPAIAHKSGPSSSQAVGTVVSYTDGTLVITSGGMPVSGRVTGYTKVRWDRRKGHDHGRHRGHDERGARSSRRGGGDDDRGGRGDDDRGRHHGTKGGMPTSGGMPTGGGMPTSGGLPSARSGLVPGAVVRKAELKLTKRGPVWKEIRLAVPSN